MDRFQRLQSRTEKRNRDMDMVSSEEELSEDDRIDDVTVVTVQEEITRATDSQTDMTAAHIKELEAALNSTKEELIVSFKSAQTFKERLEIFQDTLINDPYALKFYTGITTLLKF